MDGGSSSEDLRVPPYFPQFSKDCKEVSAKFFFCFTEKGRKQLSADSGAGVRGLYECKNELDAYRLCNDKKLLKKN